MPYVINPLDKETLLSYIDDKAKDIIRYFVIKTLISQPEPLIGQRNLPIQVPKEHIEQWFTQALNVKPIGAGSYPIDIYNEDSKWGADLKMLNMKVDGMGLPTNAESGEASLGQKFTGTGLSLDGLFADKKYDEIKDGWLELYTLKLKKAMEDYELDKIMYFFILRPNDSNNGASFYLTGATLDINAVDSVSISNATNSSLFLGGFIDVKYGNTKIYKAKKRLELRLRPKKWIEDGFAIRINTDFQSDKIDLRDHTINNEFIIDRIKSVTSTKIDFDLNI